MTAVFSLVRKAFRIARRKTSSVFGRLLCRMAGVKLGSDCRFFGLPWVEIVGAGSKIAIGNRFRGCSEIGYNAIGVNQRVVIRTCADNAKIKIGDDVGASGCTISAKVSITIGDRVMIGAGALITDSDHHSISPEARRGKDGGASKPIVIGNDVFIGARAIILKGVTIGDGSVVGAGAVVVKDIPPMSIFAGNPARAVGTVQ